MHVLLTTPARHQVIMAQRTRERGGCVKRSGRGHGADLGQGRVTCPTPFNLARLTSGEWPSELLDTCAVIN